MRAATLYHVFSKPFLIVGHPGHELRVHRWMEIAHPIVCVLTDGSGARGEGRIDSTTTVLERIGCTRGPIYGIMSDRDIYSAILNVDVSMFCSIADQIAAVFVEHGVDCVVGDSVEGYNPSHDICRLLINAAVRIAAPSTGRIANYDFALVGDPTYCPPELRSDAIMISLDDDALARKVGAAEGYPELAGEVKAAISQYGVAPFARECLRPSDPANWIGWTSSEKPYYETYGEKRVAEGAYSEVLRFEKHVRPIAEALLRHSERETFSIA
jgi:hypothetical protein